MKPPWIPTTRAILFAANIAKPQIRTKSARNRRVNKMQKQNSRTTIEFRSLQIFIVLLASSILTCDQPAAAAETQDDDFIGGPKQQQNDSLLEQQQAQLLPTFAPTKPDELVVITSSWQEEVYLPCRILNLDEEQTVSWIRKRDSLVLTIDKLRLIDDPRFQLAQSNEDWTLILSQPSALDAGFYECQVSSLEPKLSQLIELRIVDAKSWILSNYSSLFLRPNERINLTCLIETPTVTDFVYWYKNKETIQFDNKLRQLRELEVIQGGVSGEEEEREEDQDGDQVEELATDDVELKRAMTTTKTTSTRRRTKSEIKNRNQQLPPPPPLSNNNNKIDSKRKKIKNYYYATQAAKKKQQQQNNIQMFHSSSSLIIERSQSNDTANYTCLPSNAKPSHINIVVIENGLETQPEKRSLQVTDSASSSPLNLYKSWAKNLKILVRMPILSPIEFIAHWSHDCEWWPFPISLLNQEEEEASQHTLSAIASAIREDQSIWLILKRLLLNEDSYRLTLTSLAVSYMVSIERR